MHIADGVLTLEATAVVTALSAVFLYGAFKSLPQEKVAIAASMSALFFIASFIHIPFGMTQIHLLLIGMIGILLGISSFLSICVALILQALLLGYGGVVSLGVNLFIMATPAVMVYYFYHSKLALKLNEKVKFFLVGFLGTFFATLFLSLILYFAKQEYQTAAVTVFSINIVSMVIEGVVSLFLLLFIKKTYPKILEVK
jgi:cobalt/nickel transport system permease protein